MEDRCPTCKRAYRKDRSNNQNRYYWGIVIDLLSEHTGFDREETHEILKHKFLRKTVWVTHNVDGVKEMNVITKSTTGLTTKQFEEFLSQIRMWSSHCLGVFIPEPNEILDENLK